MKVWKHHIAEHFEDGLCSRNATILSKGTVFTNYDEMLLYLYKTDKRWYIAELEVDEKEIAMYKNGYMATILVDKEPLVEFRSIKIERLEDEK
jgi:hypothetical protein